MYFAGLDTPTTTLIDRCEKEIQNWGTTTSGNTMFAKILEAYWRNLAAYYSCLIEPNSYDSALGFAGERGELVRLLVPKARTLIRQFVALATRQRYQFEIVSDVNDTRPLETARLGKAICAREVEKHRMNQLGERITETVAVKGLCWVSNTWATDQGEIWARATDNTVLYTGGTKIEIHDLHDTVFNWGHGDENSLEWLIIKRRYNRWNLIAQFPELEEKIRALPSVKSERMLFPVFNHMAVMDDDDYVYIREFYHCPTPAVPFGRMTVYANHDCTFYDGRNLYERIPAELFRFQNVDSTLLGYPMLSSLLPAQQMLDHEVSVVASNHSAFGVQSVLVPKGSDLSIRDVREGLNFISYTPQNAEGGGEPKALQLTSTPAEFFTFTQSLGAFLDELSMINSTLRGAPPANVTSGAMAATLAAQALEFINSDTKGLTIGVERLMTLSIENFKRFATVEQVIDVVGEGNISSVQNFKSDALTPIRQVKCRVGNPLLSTIAGRLQLGESIMPLLQAGQTAEIGKYLSLIEGAPVESLFDTPLTENIYVQQEIEKLMRGENVFPLISDNHPMFIREYQKLTYNQALRSNSALMQHILDLMLERLSLEGQLDPRLKAILRNEPMPQMLPQAAQGGNQPPVEAEEPPSAAMEQDRQEVAQAAAPAQPEVA